MDDVYTELVQASQVSPELDSSYDISTLTDDEGQQLLIEMEEQVRAGLQEVETGRKRMKEAIFYITEGGLWLFAMNKVTGAAFRDEEKPKKEDYLRQLADDMQVSRSTIFDSQSVLRISMRGLRLSMEEVDHIGLPLLKVVKSYVNYDRETGEITGVPGAELPAGVEPGEYVRQAVVEAADELDKEHRQPRHFRPELKKRLGIQEPDIQFFAVPVDGVDGDSFELGYRHSMNGNLLSTGLFRADDVPGPVKDKLFQKLHILEFS